MVFQAGPGKETQSFAKAPTRVPPRRRSCRMGGQARAQASLPHQGKNALTEIFEIGQKIVEVHLHSVTARLLEPDKPIDYLFRRSNKMHVSPDHPLLTGRLLPRGL